MKTRLYRLASAVADYVFSWRIVPFIVVVGSFLVAFAVGQPVVQVVAVATGTFVLFILLAQLNYRIDTAVPKAATAPGTNEAERPQRPSDWEPRPFTRPEPAVVTLVIPGRNEARYVRDCIASIKRQTLQNFEAIIVDDCSTDTTLDELLEAVNGDTRFRILRTQESIGPGLARNLGVQQSTTKYITFLDLDDFLAPDALADRVGVADQHSDMPWVAGSYCWHHSVRSSETLETWSPPNAGQGGTVSWLGHHDDNVFVISAPLIRRDAFLAVGGFDDDPTAEDPILWFKMMRWGFIFVGTGTTGIAYRQKPSSRAVTTALAMRDAVAALLADRSRPKDKPSDQRGPFFYGEGLDDYRSKLGFARRTASALGLGTADRAPDSILERLVEDLRELPEPLVGWEVDVRGLAKTAARRVTQAYGEQASEPVIERRIDRLINPLIDEAHADAGTWALIDTAEAAISGGPSVAYPVRQLALISVTPQSLRTFTREEKPLLLLPSAAYHTDELIELVPELRRRGFSPIAMLNEHRWETTGQALARVDVPALMNLPVGDWLFDFAGIFTFNDWGEYYADYVRHVADHDTISFAKVEGVQDWDDDDTGRVRSPYLAAAVVLCQGDNDVAALKDRRNNLEVVGSDRLEHAWRQELPPDTDPRVVGNVNFTYGVLTDHRDLWVETVREACRRARVPLDLSLHPSETASYGGLSSDTPLRHLLVEDSILVSRFSTVLYEAMARGCSTIYYNPHGEQVPTFASPEGAFDVAGNPTELAAALEMAKTRARAEAKPRASGFFAKQVSMLPGDPVAARTAEVIANYVGA